MARRDYRICDDWKRSAATPPAVRCRPRGCFVLASRRVDAPSVRFRIPHPLVLLAAAAELTHAGRTGEFERRDKCPPST
jgi:hypothetical protein